MGSINSVQAVSTVMHPAIHLRFEDALDRGMSALAQTSALRRDVASVDAPVVAVPLDSVGQRIAVGLRRGFVSVEAAHMTQLLTASQNRENSVDATKIMLATHKFQMAAALSTAVQTMSSNVKQAVDKLITAS